ncbi:MAG: hypothetical protein KDD67_13565, partial [Ignavibacteriae bacterium]|nr:hypothetical protein [Ignavibacteriota bacterium]
EGAIDTKPGMPIPERKAFIVFLAPKGQNGRESMSRPPAQGRKIQIAIMGRGVQPSAFPSAMYHCSLRDRLDSFSLL